MRHKTKATSFRPELEMKERMEKLSKLEDRKMTWIIDECIRQHLPVMEKRYGTLFIQQ